MSADLYFTGILSFFFFLSFFRQLISELDERNSTISGHMVGSKCNLKMHVRNLGYPLPYKSVSQNHLFRWFRNLRATLTAYIFGVKHDIHNWASALQTTGGLLRRLKMTWTLVHKRLQNGSEFLPILRKFCIPLHCHTSHAEISKRNSTKLSQTVDGGLR